MPLPHMIRRLPDGGPLLIDISDTPSQAEDLTPACEHSGGFSAGTQLRVETLTGASITSLRPGLNIDGESVAPAAQGQTGVAPPARRHLAQDSLRVGTVPAGLRSASTLTSIRYQKPKNIGTMAPRAQSGLSSQTRNQMSHQAFLTQALRVAQQEGFQVGSLQDGDYKGDEGPDYGIYDSKGERAAAQLRNRLLNHLAALLSKQVPMSTSIAMMKANAGNSSAVIWVANNRSYPGSTLPESHTAIVHMIGDFLRTATESAKDVSMTAYQALWKNIFDFSDLDKTYSNLRNIFKDHELHFDDLVSLSLNALDEEPGDVDHQVGDALISLRQYMGNTGCMDERTYNGLYKAAMALASLDDPSDRLRRFIGKKSISDALYKEIGALVTPRNALETISQISHTSKALRTLTINIGMPSTTGLRPLQGKPIPEWAHGRSKWLQEHEAAGKTNPKALSPARDYQQEARQWLPSAERELPIHQLRPSKRQLLLLLSSDLQGKSPAATDEPYLLFGFAACQNEDEKTHLRYLYRNILLNSPDKENAFRAVWEAQEANQLVYLLEQNGSTVTPGVGYYLSKPIIERESVWRLKQFLAAEHITEVPGFLRRDYGFQYCRMREEVLRLKKIYRNILKVATPLDLHEACTIGKIYEFAREKGVSIEPRDRRLTQNVGSYGNMGIGFEGLNLPKKFQDPMFKKEG